MTKDEGAFNENVEFNFPAAKQRNGLKINSKKERNIYLCVILHWSVFMEIGFCPLDRNGILINLKFSYWFHFKAL